MTAQSQAHLAVWICRIATYTVVGVVAWVLASIVLGGLPAISSDFLFGLPREGGAKGGILPAILGTLYLTIGTILIALPLGMGAAIYLSEYAGDTLLTNLIRLGILTLAGIPSVVFGLFGLGLFVVFLGFGVSLLAGCLTLAFMILPVIIVASEEALRAVPQDYRDASLALGATRWQAIRTNVLPYSLPGMLTGSILGIARAAGETAPILLTCTAFMIVGNQLPSSLLEEVMALPYHLYILATQHSKASELRPQQYAVALVLIAIVLGVNLVAIVARNRLRKKYRW